LRLTLIMTLIAPQPLKPRPRQKSIISLETFLGRSSSCASMHSQPSPHSHSRQSSWGVVVPSTNGQSQQIFSPSTPPQRSGSARKENVPSLHGYTNFYNEYPVHIYKANDSVEELFQKMKGASFLDEAVSPSVEGAVAGGSLTDPIGSEIESTVSEVANSETSSDYYAVPHSPVARISRNPIILNSSFRGDSGLK
jgi:hypothetical protein